MSTSIMYNVVMEVCGYKVRVWVAVMICVLAAAMYAFYRWLTINTLKRLGVPGPSTWISLRSTYQLLRKGRPLHHVMMEWRQNYGDVVGYHLGRQPIMCFFDPDIIRLIMVKEFSNFTNRGGIKLGDPVWDKMVISLQDDHWKRVRTLLTPTFSSGRLRRMTSQLNRAGRTLVENLRCASTEGAVVEVKERAGAFTMDVIASTAFGIDIDSKRDPNNVFVRHGKTIINPRGIKYVLFVIVALLFPKLLPYLQKIGIGLFSGDNRKFFVNVVDQALNARRTANSEQRANDFIQLMVEAQVDDTEIEGEFVQDATHQKGLTHDEILGQGLIFFLAGYETVANALAFFLYSMALHAEIQERVFDEIDELLGDEEPDHDNIVQLKYLEQCLDESMRVYPPAPIVDRVCSRDITLGTHFIPAGMRVHIPVQALHYDPQVFPNPEEFRPERFTPEAKASRSPFSFMPFGAGPRMCIAMRLGMLELKIAAIYLLRHFRFSRCDETEIPLKLNLKNRPKNGIRLFVEARA